MHAMERELVFLGLDRRRTCSIDHSECGKCGETPVPPRSQPARRRNPSSHRRRYRLGYPCRALPRYDYHKLDDVLRVGAELRLKQAGPYLGAIHSDEKLPLSSRLLAGLVLARIGDKRGADLFVKTALSNSSPWRDYAIAVT